MNRSTATWCDEIDRRIDDGTEDLRAVRRYLHAHPEPSREEYGTVRYLARKLTEAGVPHREVLSGRGLIAGPELGDGGRCVAIRGDIDALRIQDEKAVSYGSTRAGVMHACGHDAHAAMALGAALALHRLADRLPPTVSWRAVFQPSEEVGEGAAEMVAAGAVDGVDAILALHVDPERQVGCVGVRPGVLTAVCQEVDVTVRGVGGHAARPHRTVDPIASAAHLVSALYLHVPRSVDSRDPVVLSFGAISGGVNPNVIPERVELRGTLRTLDRATAAAVRDRIEKVARGVAESGGASIEVTFGPELDAVVNDPRVTRVVAAATTRVLGAAAIETIPLPSLGGEDFSAYLARVPGCMLRLGVASGAETSFGLHHPCFDIDERALAIGAKILARGVFALAEDIIEAGPHLIR